MLSIFMAVPEFISNIIDRITSFFETLTSISVFGNSGLDYLKFVLIFFAVILSMYIIKFYVIRKIRRRLESRERERAVKAINVFGKLLNIPVIFSLALYISTNHLIIDPALEIVLNILIFGTIALYIYRFVSDGIEFVFTYQEKEKEQNEHIISFAKMIINSIVIVILALWVMSTLEINITGFVAGVGIMGLVIAFALQEIMADLFSSITIYLDRPFEIGDFVEINNVRGDIEKIGIRSTHIRSLDGHLVVISNQKLTKAEINNFKQMVNRRYKQIIGVSCDTPVETLRQIPQIIENIILEMDQVELVDAYLKDLSDYSWNFELIYRVLDPSRKIYRDKRQEINFRILEEMEEHGIEIPYPISEIQFRGNTPQIKMD